MREADDADDARIALERTGRVKRVVEFTLNNLYKLLLTKCFYDELANGDDLFDHGGMLDRVHVPFDGPAARAQRVARTLGPRQLHRRDRTCRVP